MRMSTLPALLFWRQCFGMFCVVYLHTDRIASVIKQRLASSI